MAVFYSQSFATAIAQTLRTIMANGGKLRIYSGVRPTTPDDPVNPANLLVEFDIPAPAYNAPMFDAVLNRIVMQGAAVAEAIATGAGFAAWGRLSDSLDAPVIDGNAGNLTSDAMFKISSTNILAGSTIALSANTFIQPKA